MHTCKNIQFYTDSNTQTFTQFYIELLNKIRWGGEKAVTERSESKKKKKVKKSLHSFIICYKMYVNFFLVSHSWFYIICFFLLFFFFFLYSLCQPYKLFYTFYYNHWIDIISFEIHLMVTFISTSPSTAAKA